MATIAPVGRWVFYNNGSPLSGGKVYTYEAGTSTPKTTFTTEDEATANANPVILDSNGSADIWLGDGGYKFVVTDSADVTVFTTDDIGGSSSTAFGGAVNAISSNTAITEVYKNSFNVCTSSPTLSLLSTSAAGEGFYITATNNGAGVVTIDPDGSELIAGSATYTLAAGESAIVICDGSAWQVFSTKDFAQLGNAQTFSAAQTFTASADFDGGFTVAASQTIDMGSNRVQSVATPTAGTDAANKSYVDAFVYPKFISGLAWARDAGDTDHDIEIQVGAAADDTNANTMVLSSIITKQIDATWAVGDNAGGLDTGTVANNTWYHIFLIKRSDTGVVDALFSTSPTSPTMPTNYDLKRRIGAIKTDGSANFVAVTTYGSGAIRTIQLNTPVQEVNTTSSTTAANITLTSVPTGVKVTALFTGVGDFAGGAVLFYDPDSGVKTPSLSAGLGQIIAANNDGGGYFEVVTNTSAQVAWDSDVAGRNIDVSCLGWKESL